MHPRKALLGIRQGLLLRFSCSTHFDLLPQSGFV